MSSSATRLTLAGIPANRSRPDAPPMPTGVAAGSNSDMFKSPANALKPKAKRWDGFLTEQAKARTGSSLKALAILLKDKEMVSLAGGLPSTSFFPIDELSIKAPSAPTFSKNFSRTATKSEIAQGEDVLDLSVALNYAQCTGLAPFLRYITEHTEIVHNPPYADWHCTMSVGSTSAWDILVRLLCEAGDTVLAEQYTFSSALETFRPFGIKSHGVDMDDEGILPCALDRVMSNWDEQVQGSRKPHVLYLIPTGQNPTGGTHSLQRRRDVYEVCQRHNIIIVEDEPYYFLQLAPYKGGGVSESALKEGHTHEEFLQSLVPSYLSMDVDGRVVRLDSFSKTIAPGSRVGWITASHQIVERFDRYSESSTQCPSGISQVALYKLLDQEWGHGGFLNWLEHIQAIYTKRRDVTVKTCETDMPAEVTSWKTPQAGMFHWISIDWKKHPLYKSGGLEEYKAIETAIFTAAIEAKSIPACGSWFLANAPTGTEGMYFRMTFASAPEDKIVLGVQRFAAALRQTFQL